MASKHTGRPGGGKKKSPAAPLLLVLVAAAALLGVIIFAVQGCGSPSPVPGEDSPAQTTTAAPATTTAPPTTTTAAPTTTTAKPTAPTKAPVLDDGEHYIDENGLLQFHPGGHYVQAASYPAGQEAPWQLLLVNDWNPLPAGYDDGVTIVGVGNRGQRVDKRIIPELTAMLEAGKAYGIDVQSGYRAASLQKKLYWRQVDRFGARQNIQNQLKAGRIVKRPGFSEHNCGLAVDLGGSGNFKLETDFETTPAFAWLMDHAHEYGFILRFPKGKEASTGVIYEAWHFRYVGKEIAAEIRSKGITLEEYLEQTRQ